MNFSFTSNQELISEDLRTAFVKLIRDEIPAREPSQAVKLLYNTEPEQLSVHFTCSKKTSS